MRAGKQAAAGAYERAKGLPGQAMAALKGLVRKGAAAAIKQGRGAERAGREAERTTVTTRTTSGGGRGVAPSTETTVQKSGGGKRRAVGRLLQKAGKAVAGAMKSRMSRGDYEQRKANRAAAARQAADDVVASTPKAALPSAEMNKRRRSAEQKKAAAAAGRVPGETRVGAPAGTFKTKKSRREATKMMKRLGVSPEQVGESIDFELLAQYIMEDFINEGYADTYEEALEILENLSEGSILELTEMYLEG
jgi:hypothetical protein